MRVRGRRSGLCGFCPESKGMRLFEVTPGEAIHGGGDGKAREGCMEAVTDRGAVVVLSRSSADPGLCRRRQRIR